MSLHLLRVFWACSNSALSGSGLAFGDVCACGRVCACVCVCVCVLADVLLCVCVSV